MKNQGLRVFIACTLGAFIGGLIASSLDSYWWMLGALLGGVVSYVTVDPWHFAESIQLAWRTTVSWRPSLLAKTFFHHLTTSILLGLTGGLYVTLILSGWAYQFSDGNLEWSDILLLFAMFGTMGCMFSLIIGSHRWRIFENAFIRAADSPYRQAEKAVAYASTLRLLRRHWNPVTAPFRLLYILGRTLLVLVLYVIGGTPGAVRISWKFLLLAFLYVHSDLRLLCFVDAALGTVLGYYGGSIVGGAIAGGALGLLNYWFVSVWWLKLHHTASR